MKKERGFTLIELLAVIIILGVIMLIAIPSVTRYINDSRKETYIDTARQIVKGAIPIVNSGELDVYDMNTTYYIPASCIPTENAMSSPFGEFQEAYVIVGYTGEGYVYYWASVDKAHQGIEMKEYNKLTKSDVRPNIESIDTTLGIGSRSNIKILDTESCQTFVSGDTSGSGIVYPDGKTKETTTTGDLVKIGTEEFYVIKHDGDDLILLSHYNLNVGNRKKEGAIEGIQNSEVKGYISGGQYYGIMRYSDSYYWYNMWANYGGTDCTSNTHTEGTICTYVYDSNSNVYQYIENYKSYLEESGIRIKKARLMRVEEAFELGCGNGTYSCKNSPANAPSWIYETSYFLGSSNYLSQGVWHIKSDGNFDGDNYSFSGFYGIRPVIVI